MAKFKACVILTKSCQRKHKFCLIYFFNKRNKKIEKLIGKVYVYNFGPPICLLFRVSACKGSYVKVGYVTDIRSQ